MKATFLLAFQTWKRKLSKLEKLLSKLKMQQKNRFPTLKVSYSNFERQKSSFHISIGRFSSAFFCYLVLIIVYCSILLASSFQFLVLLLLLLLCVIIIIIETFIYKYNQVTCLAALYQLAVAGRGGKFLKTPRTRSRTEAEEDNRLAKFQ